MADNYSNNIQDRLLDFMKVDFPLVKEPYAELGARLGINGEEVIQRIQRLRNDGIVRMISAVVDARSLGYQSTLVGMKVPDENIQAAERYLAVHSGISHGYRREHEYNIWVTLALPPQADMKEELRQMSERAGAEKILSFPAIKVYKLRTNFNGGSDGAEEDGIRRINTLQSKVRLSDMDGYILNVLQQDLPLQTDPFHAITRQLDISFELLMRRFDSLKRRKVIRRYGASVNHYKAGYKANAMACWQVPVNRVDEVGNIIASFRSVSHCYERQTHSCWPYNVFSMVHATAREECLDTIRKISDATGIMSYSVLFSVSEFKKTRITYRV